MLHNPIGETLLRLLKRYDIQQSTLALRMDISDTTVSRWVNGTRPRAEQWPGILKGIGCSHLELEVELTRVMCEHCLEQARKVGEVAPVFSGSLIVQGSHSPLAGLIRSPSTQPTSPASPRLLSPAS